MGTAPSCQPNCRADCKTFGGEPLDDVAAHDDRPPELIDLPPGVAATTDPTQKVGVQQGSNNNEITSADQLDGTPETVRQRPPFDVELERTGPHWRTLGLLVSPDDDIRYLVVDDIWEPSLISQWNKEHDEDKQVKPQDIITSINGSTCNGEEMLAKIQALGKGSKLRISIK